MSRHDWQREFFITGILKHEVNFITNKLKSGVERKGAIFELSQTYKKAEKRYLIITYSKSVLAILEEITKQTYMQVAGMIAPRKGCNVLLAMHIKLLKRGSRDLEVYNGNKNDSNKLVDGQGVSQD